MDHLLVVEKDLSCGVSKDEYLQIVSKLIDEVNDNIDLWTQCLKIINSTVLNDNTIRTYRAILILIRNLSVFHHSDSIPLIQNLRKFISNSSNQAFEYYNSIISIYAQILANISHNGVTNISQILAEFDRIGTNLVQLPQDPTVVFLSNLLTKEEEKITSINSDDDNPTIESTHITPYQQLFKCQFILPLLGKYFEKVDFENLNDYNKLLIKLLFSVISNEGFGNWLRLQSQNDELEWIKLCQLLVPENSSWSNQELLGLLGWLTEIFLNLNPKVIETIGTKNIEAYQLSIVLDMIAELCHFNIFKQGLISYKIIEPVILLFGSLQKHIKPLNVLKPADENVYSYPHLKSTIIEIISYLCHETPEIQNRVRELHGLELVLSSCIIDDNNPYIKERAITCLKFLLSNNPENQQVVRELEAQGTDENKILGMKNVES